MSEETEVEDITDAPAKMDKAFFGSENHSLNGDKLQPYSEMRVVAAQAMGLHFGTLDEASRERFKRNRIYPGAVRDVAIVLWLCSLENEDDVDMAARDPRGAAKKAMKWAGSHKLLDTTGEEFWKGYILFFDILDEINQAQIKPEKKSSSESQTNPIPPAQSTPPHGQLTSPQ